MKTCDECAYWSGLDSRKFDGKEARECHCPMVMHEHENPNPKQDCALTWDASSYSSGLVTGPKFGCIHFSAIGALSRNRGGIEHPTAEMQLAGGEVLLDMSGGCARPGAVGWLTATRVWLAMQKVNSGGQS